MAQMGMIGDGVEIMKLLNMGANADLHEKLGKFIDRANDLQAKVEELEEKIKQLEERLRFKGQLVRIGGSLFVEGDDDRLCARCAEVDGRLVHLIPRGMALPICPQCKVEHNGRTKRSAMPADTPVIPFSL